MRIFTRLTRNILMVCQLVEHFSWYYRFLKKRPSFNLKQHIEQLSQHIGLNIDVINFMTKVFFELEFVTIENGLTTVVENAPKQSVNRGTVI